MSYCQASDLGTKATIETVRTVASILDGIVSEHALYTPESSWTVQPNPIFDAGQFYTSLTYGVRSIASVQPYIGMLSYGPQYLAVGGDTDRLDGKVYRVPDALRLRLDGEWQVTGVRGYATLKSLAQGADLSVGQSILRQNAVVLIEKPETSRNGDVLIVPPAELRQAAIVIGTRLFRLLLDRRGDVDAKKFATEADPQLTDGIQLLVRKYQIGNRL